MFANRFVSSTWGPARPAAKNPIIYGADRTARYLNILRACSQARMEALGW